MSNAAKKELSELDKAYAHANTQFQLGNTNAAIDAFEQVIEIDPEHAPSHFTLGIICYQVGNVHLAYEYLNKSLKYGPDNPNALNAFAVMQAALGKQEEAIKSWERAIEVKENYADAHSNLANALEKKGEYEEALKHANIAIKSNPDLIDAYVNKGNAYVGLDRLDDTIEILETARALNPNVPSVLTNLGNAYRDKGDLQKAEEICRIAVELSPNMPEAHNNLGNALGDLGEAEEAANYFRTSTNLRPEYFEAHNNHAIACIRLLDYEQAQISARYAIAFKPDFAKAHSNLSISLRELGRTDEAKYAAQEAIRLEPENASYLVDLADILFLEDRFDDAEVVLQKAVDLGDANANLYLKLAATLERTGKSEEAIAVIDKTVDLYPELPEVYHRKSMIYFHNNKLDEAMKALDSVFEINEDYVAAWSTKSEILQSLGRMDEALVAIRKGLELYKLPFLYFSLAKIKKFTKDDPDLLEMERLAKEQGSYGLDQEASLHFSLFRAYEDIKQYDKAFEALKIGNDSKRSLIPYMPEIHTRAYKANKEKFKREYLESVAGQGHESDLPVFILGMPRSGSTLTEQVLASHPDVFGAGELVDLSNYDNKHNDNLEGYLKEIGEGYCKGLREYHPTAKRITDKMPGNFMRIGVILTSMPNAKIIHTKRNAIDTCLSCYKQLFSRGQYWSYDLEEMAHYYKEYEAMMAYWLEVFPDQIYEIQYEETVNDFENQARALIDYVGLEWNDACLTPHKTKRPILTASKGQVVKPVYKTSVKSYERYEDQLQPLINALKS